MTRANIDELVATLTLFVLNGQTRDDATARLERLNGNPADVAAARLRYETELGLIYKVDDPGTILANHDPSMHWYPGPQPDHTLWPATKAHLSESLDSDAIESIDKTSSRIVGSLSAPNAGKYSTRGLVLGYVQSGKTTNFTSVIAKAADVGYRVFIVLSGVTDGLRAQTQERIDEALLGPSAGKWYPLTTIESDFHTSHALIAPIIASNQKMIAVVKKNGPRLRRLKRWLKAIPNINDLPILIIDDEADQASIDVSDRKRARVVSRINGLIRQLLEHDRSAYVAYTATPFANLLIDSADSTDLYPRDFIVSLPEPAGYFGSEAIFGREEKLSEEESDSDGMDIVRTISVAEASTARPPSAKGAVYGWTPSIGLSLRDAVSWYLLATAARYARGETNLKSTMLVHTSMLGEAHRRLSATIKEHWGAVKKAHGNGDTELLNHLKLLWETESKRIPASAFANQAISFEEIEPFLAHVLTKTEHVIDNYRSKQRLIYKRGEEKLVIAVGGNTLSRGLTLEGLVSSYFVRSASAYDTLLQMGRWFGYRRKYEDLPRIWVTTELRDWFRDLSFVEAEIRQEIERYALGHIKPSEVGVRIRSHPRMVITAAAKMRNAINATWSYSRQHPQTIVFQVNDKPFLQHNITSTKDFLKAALKEAGGEVTFASGKRGIEGVSASLVMDYLQQYRVHENTRELNADLLKNYIKSENSSGALELWNVVIIDKASSDFGVIDLGFSATFNLLVRSRLKGAIGWANIKALSSKIDRIADLPTHAKGLHAGAIRDKLNDSDLIDLRDDVIGDRGLLCIYPIQAKSAPAAGSNTREPLDAEENVIGVSIFFPEAQGKHSNVNYKIANIAVPDLESEDDEFEEFEESENEDENA